MNNDTLDKLFSQHEAGDEGLKYVRYCYANPAWASRDMVGMEQQLAELREAVDEVLNASVSSLEYRSNRLQLAVWDLRAVRDKALLQESGDE